MSYNYQRPFSWEYTAADAAATICALEVKHHLDASQPLEDKIKKAFSVAKSFWMSTDDGVRFKGALAGVMQVSTPEEQEVLVRSSRALQRFNAAISAAHAGVEVDMVAVAEQQEKDKPLPLLGWWHEAVPS